MGEKGNYGEVNSLVVNNLSTTSELATAYSPVIVTDITQLKPQAGIKPVPSCQAGQAGGADLPAPRFALKSKNPGAGINPALATAARPVLGPKSYAQALVGLAEPRQANFSCP
ncbi:hypothetical protein DSO57_1000063 [Entomophthora muscae]|uniref:Uncharacterized protein n=1 Tax=Entomophthora muscae TaxID=34485 RepID=A0ACC2SML0_9FUNG|nr:hypothetical protein DSO57_1000063 [Entomophthora muscae]